MLGPHLYTYLCEWAYEVYDQMDHPALGQTPRAMFVNGLAGKLTEGWTDFALKGGILH